MSQKPSDSYCEVSKELLAKATFTFTARYSTGRGRNVQLENGVSVWYPVGKLEVIKDYCSNLKIDLIEVEPIDALSINGQELTREHTYLILLNPSNANRDILEGKYSGYLTIAREDEVVAIIRLQ